MPKRSAGLPYWSKKNEGSWTLPKGEYDSDENPLAAAIREFQEETGFSAFKPFLELGTIQQKSGKFVGHGPLKVIVTLQSLSAIHAKWSGRHILSKS